jgi:uncharacterized protein (UPF0248 family)
MITLRALLSRIRWDPQFGTGDFTLGYYDRITHEIVSVPLSRVRFAADDHFFFEATEADGSVHTVPFHRVREVRRDGQLIWHRTGGASAR